jgi:outer membrane protein
MRFTVSAAILCTWILPSAVHAAPRNLTLDDAIKTALETNFDVRAAKEEQNKQEANLRSTVATLLPKLTLTGGFSQTDSGLIPSVGGRSFGNPKRWNSGVELSQDLFTGGQSWNTYKRQKLVFDSSTVALEATQQRVGNQAKRAFFDALLAQRKVRVQKQLVALREETLSSERNKLAVGSVSQFNVLRAEVALANSKTPLIQAENAVHLSREELKRVLGVLVDSIVPAGELEVVQPPATQEDQALSIALEKRPDLKQAKLLAEAAERGVAIQRADYLPKVSAYADYIVQNNQFGGSGRLDGWQAGIRGSWNIFDSFKREGQIASAQSQERLAGNEVARIRQEIEVQVRRAILSWAEAEQLLDASRKVVQQADESRRLAQARFDVGAATQLDVLDSQVQLAEAQTNEINALHQLNTTKASLELAMGIP